MCRPWASLPEWNEAVQWRMCREASARMNGKKTACVVLPTYNEAENIPILIPKILEEAGSTPGYRVLVLVVDDASPDGTAREVERLSRVHPEVFLLSGKRQGIGAAYLRGMTLRFCPCSFGPALRGPISSSVPDSCREGACPASLE